MPCRYNSPHRLPNGKCYFTKALPSLNYNGLHDDNDDDDELIRWNIGEHISRSFDLCISICSF